MIYLEDTVHFLPIVSFPHMAKVKWVEKLANFRLTESPNS